MLIQDPLNGLVSYSSCAVRTIVSRKTLLHESVLGMATELLEVEEKSNVKPLVNIDLIDELGDLIWYVNMYCYLASDYDVEKCYQLLDHILGTAAGNLPPGQWFPATTIAANLIDVYKREVGYGVPMTVESVMPYVTSISYYIALCIYNHLNAHGIKYSHIMTANIIKLVERYGDCWDQGRAVQRDKHRERCAVEAYIKGLCCG